MRLFGQQRQVSNRYIAFASTDIICEIRLTTPLERSIVYPCYFVFFGSWLGAIPIALDWDRPWQVRNAFWHIY